MANSLDTFYPEIWAQETLVNLEENFVLGGLVYRDFDDQIAKYGDIVNTRKPSIPAVTAKAAATDYVAVAASSTNVAVTLNKQYYVSHVFDDVEIAKSFKDLAAEFIEPAAIALARQVDTDLVALFPGFTTNVVSAGTAPLVLDDLLAGWEKLVGQKVPMAGWWGVLHPEAAVDILQSDTKLLQKSNESGRGTGLTNALVGRLYDTDWYVTQSVPKVTSGVSPSPEIRNFMCHPQAIGLISRPLPAPPAGMGVQSATVMKNNISIRVVTGYDIRAGGMRVTLETLYGVAELYDNLGCLIKTNG